MEDYYPDEMLRADYYPDDERAPIPEQGSGRHPDWTPCYGTGGCSWPKSCEY